MSTALFAGATWLCLAPTSLRAAPSGFIDMLETGGWAMWPLALCSLATIYLAVAAALDLRTAHFLPGSRANEAAERALREPESLARDAGRSSEECGEACRTLLERLAYDAAPDAARHAALFGESLARVEQRCGSRIHHLNVIVAVAPMIGLLGTVSGMIGAFQTISGGGMGRAEMLAGDIGEALITTAAGLVVAIPALVFHVVLRARLQELVRRAEEWADRAILTAIRLRAGEDP